MSSPTTLEPQRTCSLLLLLLLLSRGGGGVEYSDLEHMAVNCPLKDSCSQNFRSNFTDRNCECDLLCGAFGDCCVDATSSTRSDVFLGGRLSCVAVGDSPNLGVYAVDSCPNDFSVHGSLRAKCVADLDYADPLMSTPVTDTFVGITYKNRYCAECNGASPSSVASWLISVYCDSIVSSSVNDTFIWDNLRFEPDLGTWGVQLGDEFHSCDMTFDKPDYVTHGFRFCRANIVSTCPDSWRRESYRSACKAYMAVLYDAESSFRNAHCAVCNGRTLTHLSCYGAGISTRKHEKSFSFALLVDVNRSDGDIVGASRKCPEDEKFDPFFKKCRKLKCALPGFKMVDGKCQKDQ